MSLLYRPEDIHDALVAVEAQAKATASREEGSDDHSTIRPRGASSSTKHFEATTFEGFMDFELDLTCLSAPSSPVPSTSHLPPASPSPPPSPPPEAHRPISRTRSFASQAISPLMKSSKKLSTPQLSSMTMPSGSRGSWPGITKYTGRGTPIDRQRNRQWGGFITEEDDTVAEDGLLFSAIRPASLDSHVRPSKRSLSPEWNYLPALTTSISSQHDEDEASITASEPPPALGPINLGTDQSDDWDSIMKTVLGSTNKDKTPSASSLSDSTSPQTPIEAGPSANPEPKDEGLPVPPVDFPMMTPDQIEELHNGLESHLGIHQALDLGLGINIPNGAGGSMNLFKLGLLPSSASGRETPSIYSQPETPRGSPPATVIHHDDRGGEGHPLSNTTTKAESNRKNGVKSVEQPWWRRILKGVRRIQDSITQHKHREH